MWKDYRNSTILIILRRWLARRTQKDPGSGQVPRKDIQGTVEFYVSYTLRKAVIGEKYLVRNLGLRRFAIHGDSYHLKAMTTTIKFLL